MTTLEDMMSGLSPERKAKIEKMTSDLIAEEMTLKDLRKAREMTQQKLSEVLGIGQDSISRLEKRSDLLISTLKTYLAAMGGNLKLMVEFEDRPPVDLSLIMDKLSKS